MKRLLIFALLGPLLGVVTGLWGILPVLNWTLGAPTEFHFTQIVLLPLGYGVGLVPAIVTGWFDGYLARRNIQWRVLWTALFGFAMSFLPLLSSLAMGFIHGPVLLLFGIVGAVPAAICSWLSSWSGYVSTTR